MGADNQSDLFYLAFKDCYPCWTLILCASAFGFIGIVGIVLNASVIYITCKTKSLRGTAGFLLALNSMFELLHQHGHFLFVYTSFSGINFIDYRSAVRIGSVFLVGLFGSNLSMLFTGLDRSFCVIFPILYKCIMLMPYLTVISFICVLISTSIMVFFHINAEAISAVKVTGTIGDLLKGNAGAFYAKYGLTTNTLTIAIYIATGILARKNSSSAQNMRSSNADSFNRRIFRSLFLIISVNIAGYFAVNTFLVFVAPLLHPITMFFVRTALGLCLNVSASSIAPILYLTSTEHRKAFNLHFPFIFKYIAATNSTTIIQMTGAFALNGKATPILAGRRTILVRPLGKSDK